MYTVTVGTETCVDLGLLVTDHTRVYYLFFPMYLVMISECFFVAKCYLAYMTIYSAHFANGGQFRHNIFVHIFLQFVYYTRLHCSLYVFSMGQWSHFITLYVQSIYCECGCQMGESAAIEGGNIILLHTLHIKCLVIGLEFNGMILLIHHGAYSSLNFTPNEKV